MPGPILQRQPRRQCQHESAAKMRGVRVSEMRAYYWCFSSAYYSANCWYMKRHINTSFWEKVHSLKITPPTAPARLLASVTLGRSSKPDRPGGISKKIHIPH